MLDRETQPLNWMREFQQMAQELLQGCSTWFKNILVIELDQTWNLLSAIWGRLLISSKGIYGLLCIQHNMRVRQPLDYSTTVSDLIGAITWKGFMQVMHILYSCIGQIPAQYSIFPLRVNARFGLR